MQKEGLQMLPHPQTRFINVSKIVIIKKPLIPQ